MQKQTRPVGISIVANFYIKAGIIGIVGISLSATSATKAPGVSALSLAESLYILVTGYGLRKAKAWAWTIAIIGIFIGFATGTYAIIFNLLPMTGSISNQLGAAEAGVVINRLCIINVGFRQILNVYHFVGQTLK